MLSCHRFLFIFLINLFIRLSIQDLAVPVYTPDIQDETSNKNHQLDQIEKASKISNDDNLQASGIVVPITIIDPTINNNNNQTSSNQKSNHQNKQRKRKLNHQPNKQYRQTERKNSLDALNYNLESLKNTQINDFNNALLIELAKQKYANNQQQDLDSSTSKLNSPILSALNSNQFNSNSNQQLQYVPIFTTEISNSNNDQNKLALQLYLAKLAAIQQQQQKLAESRSEKQQQEKPKITKRVFNSNALSSNSFSNQANNLQTSASSNLQLANLNQLLQSQQQQQPVYTLIQPQQSPSSLYLALQPSFTQSTTTSTKSQQQQQQAQTNSLIETGDKIIAKIKQWSTDVFNPKSSLSRQISEVINIASDVALVTLIGVPVISLLSLGVSQLMTPLSQLNRKADRKTSLNKQKIKSESDNNKKDNKNDEKTAKSDQQTHNQQQPQKNTKSLDKKSRFVTLMEKAGDEFNHFKNLVEIARNLEMAFKKYNVQEKECKFRILCEIGSANQLLNETTTSDQYTALDHMNSNLLRRSEGSIRKKRQIVQSNSSSNNNNNVNGISNRMMSVNNEQQNQLLNNNNSKTIEQEQEEKLKKSKSEIKEQQKLSTNTNTNTQQTNQQHNFLQNQFKLIERNLLTNRGIFSNLIRNFKLDKFINENKDGFVSFLNTVDNLMNRAQKSNLINYILNEDQFRSDNKLFKTIAERSRQLQDKLKDFLDNLTTFQQVVNKEQKNIESSSKSKYNNKMFNYYNLRSKRTANLNNNNGLDNGLNETNKNEQFINEFNTNEDQNIDISGLRFVLNDLINQLKYEQQDNLILPLSRIWLNPYLNAYEFGCKHTQNQCKSRYLKCTQNYLGLNNGLFNSKLDLEIFSNNHQINQLNQLKPKETKLRQK